MSNLKDFKTFETITYSKVKNRSHYHVTCFPDGIDSLNDYISNYNL